MSDPTPESNESPPSGPPAPLPAKQRRILGVLIEKARTTPDSYPLSLNGLVTGCNQKSNRSPLMSLTAEQVEDELIEMREQGSVAEVQGGGRVAKYRHYGYDYLGVKGIEAGVMTELLLRGEQTAGDLRSRASRFGAIADVKALHEILNGLIEKQLVVTLTPPGRGQLFTHNLYTEYEMESLKKHIQVTGGVSSSKVANVASAPPAPPPVDNSELESLRDEISELRSQVERLTDRLDRLEG